MTITAYLRRLLDGPLPVGAAPEAVIREAERAGLVRYVRPHSRALTDAGRKAANQVQTTAVEVANANP